MFKTRQNHWVSTGRTLFFIGVLSMILYQFNQEVSLLMRIDNRGREVAWNIRFGLVGLGAILLLFGYNQSKEDPTEGHVH